MKTVLKLFVLVLFLVALVLPVGADCIDYEDTWCDYQCYYAYHSWWCADPNPERCCSESPSGNVCADSSECGEICDCDSPGGF